MILKTLIPELYPKISNEKAEPKGIQKTTSELANGWGDQRLGKGYGNTSNRSPRRLENPPRRLRKRKPEKVQ